MIERPSTTEAEARSRWVGLAAWEANAPDWHPGWDDLLAGMARVARRHGLPGHRCQLCDQLNRRLGRGYRNAA